MEARGFRLVQVRNNKASAASYQADRQPTSTAKPLFAPHFPSFPPADSTMSNIWGSPPTLIAPKCPSPQWQGSSIYTICADRISYDVVKKNIPLMLGGDAYVCAAENVSVCD